MARPAHRPTLFTEERQGYYLQAAGAGLPPKLCRQAAGWAQSTAAAYLARGRDARERVDKGVRLSATDRAFADFVEQVEKAEANFALGNMSIILAAVKTGTWTAAAWGLERRWPEFFGRRWPEPGAGDEEEMPPEETAEELLAQLVDLNAAAGRPKLRALPSPNGHNGDS